MKTLMNFLMCMALAIFAVHTGDYSAHFLHPDLLTSNEVVLGAFVSFANLGNIEEQTPNPPGVRRLGVIAVQDLLATTIDWPKLSEINADMQVTVALPLVVGKTVATIDPADNSCEITTESQGMRFYQSYKNGVAFEIAGWGATQMKELKKFVNTGCIFFAEMHDGQIKVIGSKLNPIVLTQKAMTGKKGGDKRGYTLSGDNDSFMFEPPIYPTTLALPGMTNV